MLRLSVVQIFKSSRESHAHMDQQKKLRLGYVALKLRRQQMSSMCLQSGSCSPIESTLPYLKKF